MSEVISSGLLYAQGAWSAAFAGILVWRLSRMMRGEDQGKRNEQLERLLRARGIEVELTRAARELMGINPVDPRILLSDETIFRESSTRWMEALLRGGADPRSALDEVEALRRRLGFGIAPPTPGMPPDGRVLLCFEAQVEVLDGRVVLAEKVVHALSTIDIVSGPLEQLDPRAVREIAALFAVGDEVATCECRVHEVQELAGGALWWRIELPREPIAAARRHQHRVPLRLAGRVVVSHSGTARVEAAEPVEEQSITAAFLLDMSLSGVRLRVAADVVPGDRVWLSVGRCDRANDELEMAGRVIWTLREEGFATATAGIEFEAFDAATRARIGRFLARRSTSPTLPGEEN